MEKIWWGTLILLMMCTASFGEETSRLRILTVSDLQGAIKPDKQHLGGLPRIAGVIKRTKEEGHRQNMPVLAINMGDNVVYEEDISTFKQFRGKPEFGGLARCSIDLAVPGNHDFALGLKAYEEALAYGNTETICSNLRRKEFPSLAAKLAPYKIMEIQGYKVGFFGLLTVAYDSAPYAYKTYITKAQEMVTILREELGCSVVIAMTHLGYLWDRKLAKNVRGIDVICGGHTHITLKNPTIIKGTPIVHAGAYGNYVGNLDLYLDSLDKVEKVTWSLIEIAPSLPEDPEMKEFLQPYWDAYPGEKTESTHESGGCSLGFAPVAPIFLGLFLFFSWR